MKTINEILNFIENHSFSFVYADEYKFANTSEDKILIINLVKDCSIVYTEVTALEEEGYGCKELENDVRNGCIVYKFWKNNQTPLYIALY